jgi:RNA polymerase sigma-70 factor (ECF subfamily)
MPEPSAATVDRLLSHRAGTTRVAWAVAAAPEDVEDAAQDAWVAFLERPPPSEGNPEGWFATVTRHAFLRRRRGAGRSARREAAVARRDDGPSTVDVVARAEAARRVAAAVLALDEPYRTALLLRYYDGLPPRDVAARTGAPVATVRTRLARGIARLRDALATREGVALVPRGRRAALAADVLSPRRSAPTSTAPCPRFPRRVLVRLTSIVTNGATTAALTVLALLLSAVRVAGRGPRVGRGRPRATAGATRGGGSHGGGRGREPPPTAARAGAGRAAVARRRGPAAGGRPGSAPASAAAGTRGHEGAGR